MITSDALYRTFFIKSAVYGTAFTIDVDGSEYLITASHLLDTTAGKSNIKLFHSGRWFEIEVDLVGHGKGEVDISVFRTRNRLTKDEMRLKPTSAGLVLGQDLFFLGFPYKMWTDVGNLMGGLPCAYVKKGTLSSMEFTSCAKLHIDAINNEGFSGGPIVFYSHENPKELRLAGVVSKYRVEYENVMDENGDTSNLTVAYNTGFLVAYGAKHITDIIADS
jgi:hypothetical protein